MSPPRAHLNALPNQTIARVAGGLLAGTVIATVLAACSPQLGGDLGQLQAMTGNCPQNTKTGMYVALDASDTARSSDISASQLAVTKTMAEQTAVCGGHLRVTAFSSSAVATVTLYDGDLTPAGATEPARLRRVPDMVNDTMKTTESQLSAAATKLPGDGSEIIAQLANVGEYGRQLGTGYVPYAVIVTDGVATAGTITNTPSFDAVTARDLGERVAVPDLTGATVTFTGIGHLAGPPPPSDYVANLKNFYTTVCNRTKATTCTVVTDFANPRSAS